MRVIHHLSACLLLASSPVLAQESGAGARVSEALALAASGDTAGALAELRQTVEAHPDYADAHFQIGRLLALRVRTDSAGQREREAAQLALLRAVALEPDNAEYLSELASLREFYRMTAHVYAEHVGRVRGPSGGGEG